MLVARDKAHALEFVRIHSRPIHLMLSDGSTEGRILASTAKLYRQAMKVLFVSEDDQAAGADVVTPDQALAAISKLFATPEVPRRGMIAGATG